MSEVARRLDRTVSEIFRMILCLEQRGYLAQSPNKERYHLTLRLFRIAQEHPPTKRLVTEALPVMHQLAQQSAAVLPSGRHRRRPRRHPRAGRFAGVDGLLCEDGLEGGPDAGGDRTRHPGPPGQGCARPRARRVAAGDEAEEAPADLDEHLEKIAARGYERRASYQVAGVVNISFPILNVQGQAIAGLTIPYVKRIEDKVSVDEVVSSACARRAGRSPRPWARRWSTTRERL